MDQDGFGEASAMAPKKFVLGKAPVGCKKLWKLYRDLNAGTQCMREQFQAGGKAAAVAYDAFVLGLYIKKHIYVGPGRISESAIGAPDHVGSVPVVGYRLLVFCPKL